MIYSTWSINTTSGLLLILRCAHILFMILWLAGIYQRLLRPGPSAEGFLWWPLALACLTSLTGGSLFWRMSSDLHSSWGLVILVGSGVGILMLINQIMAFVFKSPTEALNAAFSLPMIFLMAMAPHLGMQISPTMSLSRVVFISLLPILAAEVLGLLPVSRPFITKPRWLILLSLFLTGGIYSLMEYFSKR